MSVEFDVKMTTGKMYDYMIRHTFTSFAGIVGELLGIVLVIGFFAYGQWPYLVAGIVCVFYQPVALYRRAAIQVRNNKVFAGPLHYRLDESGITVTSGEDSDSMGWDRMYRAVSTSRSVIVYTNRVNACIFPKEDMGDKKDTAIAIISAHMDPKQVNIR
ncbi:MAG: YcxB family protein [Lachnospiraceae bacterium]|nr:YcxB family protein [Lachnospiraceae bacterium]